MTILLYKWALRHLKNSLDFKNSCLRVSELQLYQLNYQIYWEQCAHSIHLKSTKNSPENIPLSCQDVPCFKSISGNRIILRVTVENEKI